MDGPGVACGFPMHASSRLGFWKPRAGGGRRVARGKASTVCIPPPRVQLHPAVASLHSPIAQTRCEPQTPEHHLSPCSPSKQSPCQPRPHRHSTEQSLSASFHAAQAATTRADPANPAARQQCARTPTPASMRTTPRCVGQILWCTMRGARRRRRARRRRAAARPPPTTRFAAAPARALQRRRARPRALPRPQSTNRPQFPHALAPGVPPRQVPV
jgi:hypothetical protein